MMAVVFNGFITLGQAIFAIGMTLSDPSMRWPVMYVGRIIFGFGGESLSVAQSAIIAKWFVGKELALGTGFRLCCAADFLPNRLPVLPRRSFGRQSCASPCGFCH